MLTVTIEGLGECEVRLDHFADAPAVGPAVAYESGGSRLIQKLREQELLIRGLRRIRVATCSPVIINRKPYMLQAVVSDTADGPKLYWSGHDLTKSAREKLQGDAELEQRVLAAAAEMFDQAAQQELDRFYSEVSQRWQSVVRAAQSLLGALPVAHRPPPLKLCIVMEGGVIQSILSDDPRAGDLLDAVIIDYDTDGALPSEVGYVLQGDGSYSDAFVSRLCVGECRGPEGGDISLDQVWRINVEGGNPYGKET